MKILFANNQLENIGGTESYIFTLLQEFKKRNYDVEYFTFKKGLTANKIEKLGVPFMSKEKYDLIIANHNTCVEKLYDKGFIIQTCHGIFHKLEQPSIFADYHVSISQEVSQHLSIAGFPNSIIHNGINLERFAIKNKINNKLTNILSLSQSEDANNLIKDVCAELNINFSYINKHTNSEWNIENKINENDLIIGLGRSAYDAISCGRPVIIFDKRSYGMNAYIGDGYATQNFGFYLKNNCSGRYSNRIFNKEILIEEIKKYDPNDSLILRKIATENFNIENIVDQYLDLYTNLKENVKNKKSIYLYKFLRLYGKEQYHKKIKNLYKNVRKFRD